MEEVITKIGNIVGKENVILNEPMKKHTSFRTGGNAKLFVKVKEYQDILEIVKILKEKNIKFFIIGNGTNLLVRDGRF